MRKLRSRHYVLVIFVAISTVVAQPGGQEENQQDQLPPGKNVLWVDPGDVQSLDFQYGVGGSERRPQPPFRFVDEDLSGTNPKINVTDNRGTTWNVKWGHEARSSTFCTRLLWACGYYAEPEYFIGSGRIEDVHGLTRAKSNVSDDGSFVDARFQLRGDSPKFLKDHHWTWTKNPFFSARELQGLKILLLLVSNWDTKKSNLAVFADDSTGERRYVYADTDWGASLGKWGNLMTRSKWDCRGFARQTPDFVERAADGSLDLGFKGKNRQEVTADITVQDVRWLLQYLGKVTDEQIRSGLAASGASQEEIGCFSQALRQRIDQLKQVATEARPGD